MAASELAEENSRVNTFSHLQMLYNGGGVAGGRRGRGVGAHELMQRQLLAGYVACALT